MHGFLRCATIFKVGKWFVAGVLAIALFGCFSAAMSPKEAFAKDSGALKSAEVDSANAKAASSMKPAAKTPSVTITPKTQTPNKNLRKSNTYTKQLRNYWVMSYYMQLFEKMGGGTITLKKGTYQLPVSVKVPSNVTIVLEDGVIVKKTRKTGTSRVSSNTPLFQMVSPNKYKKKNAVKRYNGTKNVSIVGKGTAILDMSYVPHSCAIIMAQNQNMSFSGITFQHLNGHAFELDASKNVTIDNCVFKNGKGGKTTEAINLDTPDKNTGGFGFRWSKFDKTPNNGVTISNCTFSNVVRGIGTHKYSQTSSGQNVMHSNITIVNNTFEKIKGLEGCVVPYNWEHVTIEENTFIGTGQVSNTYAIVAHSVQDATIANNTISDFECTVLVRRGFVSSGYEAPAEVSLSDLQLRALTTNKYIDGTVAYSDAAVTSGTYYYSKMIGVWQPSTIAKNFDFYQLSAA